MITTLNRRDKDYDQYRGRKAVSRDSLLHPHHGQLFAFCRDFDIDPDSIHFTNARFLRFNGAMGGIAGHFAVKKTRSPGDQICEILQELTEHPDPRLHASVAGGPETMDILKWQCSCFGRADHALSHVLVSLKRIQSASTLPPVTGEQGRQAISTADARIYLARQFHSLVYGR